MTFYSLPLTKVATTGRTTIPIQVGDLQLTASFSWDDTMQEQWDALDTTMKRNADADPLVMKSGFIRSYDYIDFYASIGDDIEQWLDTTTAIPSSIQNMPRWQQITILTNRINECTVLASYRSALQEFLRWTCVVTTQQDLTVAVIEPGGWYQHQDNIFMFRFVTDLPVITKDNISRVTMEFGLND